MKSPTHPPYHGFAVAGVAALVLLVNLAVIPGYTGDDAFIHFTYIRNIIDRGVYGYNELRPTYGSTSVLWVLGGAAVCSVLRDIPLTMRVLAGLLLVGAALLFDRFIRMEFRPSGGERMAALVFFIGNAVVFRWCLTGMETDLVLFVVAVILLAWDREHPWRMAALFFAGSLVRPELTLFIPAYVLVALLERPIAWKKLAHIVLASLCLLGGWMTVCRIYFGTAFPLTTIKAGPWFDPAMMARCAEVVFGTYPELTLILAVLLVLRARLPERPSKVPFRERTLIVFGCLTLAFYLVSGTAVISRYLLVLHVPLVAALLWLLCSGRARRWLPRLAAGVLVVQVVLFVQIHLGPIRSFVAGFQRVYSEAGLLMRSTEPSDTASVMTSDVGMVAFYSGRPVIDLGGLTSYHVHGRQTTGESSLAAAYHPRYIVARVDTGTVSGYLQKLREGIGDPLVEVTIRSAKRIGRLGVFPATEKEWEVLVVELRYRNTVQPAAGRDGLGDSCRRRRAGYWGFCSTTCSSRFVWTYSTVSARASLNFSKSSL